MPDCAPPSVTSEAGMCLPELQVETVAQRTFAQIHLMCQMFVYSKIRKAFRQSPMS